MTVAVVFPHQLFDHHPAVVANRTIFLIEDSLFFGDRRYPLSFHKHKLILHFASMDLWQRRMEARGHRVERIRYDRERTAGDHLGAMAEAGAREVHLCYLADDILTRRVTRGAEKHGVSVIWYPSPMFLSPPQWLEEQFSGTRPPRMHTFYTAQRRRMGVLLAPPPGHAPPPDPVQRDTKEAAPLGGRWSFDSENRKSWPARRPIPPEPAVEHDEATGEVVAQARQRVDREFPLNPGSGETFWYPVTHEAARRWLDRFLDERLELFGQFEDAIAPEGTVLYHSILTPALNNGLLTPQEVLDGMSQRGLLDPGVSPELLPTIEGFIRQLIGWREYIHGLYRFHGAAQRRGNHWNHTAAIPQSFYSGTTGLLPLDTIIRRVLDRSYCHHIERLMILGNAMLLCEIHPDQVYRWFMELFIDSYDWVMVPNVYGMSQFADGGMMATKPYISGSNYIRKMSSYPGGEWEKGWTALFWRFMAVHRDFFEAQPRMAVLTKRVREDSPWLKEQLETAEALLQQIRSEGERS